MTKEMQQLVRFLLPSRSLYEDKNNLSNPCKNYLQLLSQNKDVQYNCAQAFDYLFRATHLDHTMLKSSLQNANINIYSDADALELVNYFKTDPQSNAFNKINFV